MSSSLILTRRLLLPLHSCAQNLFPVYNELKDNTQKRMNQVIGTSIGSATLIYEVMALA